jgi:toxin ParE1/3/4
MRFEIRWTASAAADLEEIIDWIAVHDSPARSLHVAEQIEAAVEALKTHPRRGARPRELLDIGVREYRETFFKPYRIVYRVEGALVYVYLVADGRRDLQALLARRLLAR